MSLATLRRSPPPSPSAVPPALRLYPRHRFPLNAHTEAYALRVRERHVLPPDLAAPVETLLDLIGAKLAGNKAETARPCWTPAFPPPIPAPPPEPPTSPPDGAAPLPRAAPY